jgi:hypothetical protein
VSAEIIDFRLARFMGLTKQIAVARRRNELARVDVLLLTCDELFVAMKEKLPQRPVRALDATDELLPTFLRRQAD